MQLRIEIGYDRQLLSNREALEHISLINSFSRSFHKHNIDNPGFGGGNGILYFDVIIDGRKQEKVLTKIQEILENHKVKNFSKIIKLDSPKRKKAPRIRGRKTKPLTKGVYPPKYLRGNALVGYKNDLVQLLYDGRWCGHGMDRYAIYCVHSHEENIFRVKLPQDDDTTPNPPMVMALTRTKDSVIVYDSRSHPSSVYSDIGYKSIKTRLKRYHFCSNCNSQWFQLVVGFEYPDDSSDMSDDVSWFVLAAKCNDCKQMNIIYSDETA